MNALSQMSCGHAPVPLVTCHRVIHVLTLIAVLTAFAMITRHVWMMLLLHLVSLAIVLWVWLTTILTNTCEEVDSCEVRVLVTTTQLVLTCWHPWMGTRAHAALDTLRSTAHVLIRMAVKMQHVGSEQYALTTRHLRLALHVSAMLVILITMVIVTILTAV